MTEEFINTLYSLSLYPKITRPSRITSHSASLIDNIFTNQIDNNTVSGLLVCDISDHLPVFTIYNNNYKNKQDSKLQYRRVRTEESMDKLRNDLIAQDRGLIYKEKDISKAYDEFLKMFNVFYDKYCPIKQYRKKQNHKDNQWITKELQNACKKKNTLYIYI